MTTNLILDNDVTIEPQATIFNTLLDGGKNLYKFIRKYWTIIAFIIPLIISAVYYYLNQPRIRYEISTRAFVSSNELTDSVKNKFKVILNGKTFQNLYLTSVEINNVGLKALDGDKVSPINKDPIRIVVPDEIKKIIAFVDDSNTSKAIDVNLITKENELIIGFNYLNGLKKIVVSILHEQPLNDLKTGIFVTGSAMDLGKIKPKITDNQRNFWLLLMLNIVYVLILLKFVKTSNKKIKYRKEQEQKNKLLLKENEDKLEQLTNEKNIIQSNLAKNDELHKEARDLFIQALESIEENLKKNTSREELLNTISPFVNKFREKYIEEKNKGRENT